MPLVVGGVHDRLVAAGAGIVDEDVGTAEFRLGGRNRGGDSGGGRDVASHGDGATLGDAGDLDARLLEPLRVASGHDDVDAFSGERLRHRQPNPDAAARDNRDLVPQSETHGFLLLGAYLTIGILLRSIVIATASMSTAPNTIC